MKDLSCESVSWPFQGNRVGGAGAGRGTHGSAWEALADNSVNDNPVEEASDEGSKPSGEGDQ